MLLDWEDVLCADCIPFNEYAQPGANSIHYVDGVFSEYLCNEDEVAARCATRAAVVSRISDMVAAQLAELKRKRIEEREKVMLKQSVDDDKKKEFASYKNSND